MNKRILFPHFLMTPAVATSGLLLMATATNAQTVTYSQTISDQPTRYSGLVVGSIQQFDTTLGPLKSATITLDGSVSGTMSFESLDASPGDIELTLSSQVTLSTTAQGALVVALPSTTQNRSVSAFDGLVDFGGTSGESLTGLFAMDTESVTLRGAALNEFVGNGFVDFALSAVAMSNASGLGNSASSFFTTAGGTVTVVYDYSANEAPTAEAGNPQSVTSGTQVTLAGSGTDNDGSIASYAWTRTGGTGSASNAVLSDASAQNPSFTDSSLTSDTDQPVTHVFSLVVTDDSSTMSEPDTVTITIDPPADVTPPAAPTVANTTVTLADDGTAIVRAQTEPGATAIIAYDGVTTQVPLGDDGRLEFVQGNIDPSVTVIQVSFRDAANNTSNALMLEIPFGPTAEDLQQIAQQTQEEISGYLQARANQVISGQPDLIGLLSGAASGRVNVDATQGRGNLDIATSAGYPVWARLQGNWSETDDAENSYFIGAAGAHYTINPNALVGVMLAFDTLTQENGDATTEGDGYLVGPYFVAKLPTQPLYFEGRYLVGETENDVSINGSTSESFDSERTLASVKVAGQLVYGATTLTPSLSATRLEDEQQAFTDASDQSIPTQSITVTDVAVGLDFATPLFVSTGALELTGGVSGIMSETTGSGNADTVEAAFDGGRGRLHLGTRYTLDSGVILSAGASYDGIGADDYESLGVNLGLDVRF